MSDLDVAPNERRCRVGPAGTCWHREGPCPRANAGNRRRSNGVDIANAAVDHQTDDTPRLRGDGEDLAPVPESVHPGDIDHQHLTRHHPGDGDVDTQVVATRALHRQGAAGDRGAAPHGFEGDR